MNSLDRKQRIACVAVGHPAHDNRIWNMECKKLAGFGFDVDYYTKYSEKCTIHGVNIKPLQISSNRFLRFLGIFKLLPKLISRNHYDSVLLEEFELLPLGILIKLLSKIVVVFDSHEDYVAYVEHRSLTPFSKRIVTIGTKFILYLSSRLFDGFIFADEGTLQEFKLLPPSRKLCLHNFPLLSVFQGKPLNWAEREYDIVYLGGMGRTAGIFHMLGAIDILKHRCPSIKALFIGEPPKSTKPEVNDYIRQHNLDENIKITARLPHSDVPALVRQGKVGLVGLTNMPKFYKNIATKMFEYMVSGVPVVSVDLPPERRFLNDGQHGYLVPVEDPDAMAEATYKILSNSELGQKMANNCYEHIIKDGLHAEKETDNLREFYDYILTHPRRRLCGS